MTDRARRRAPTCTAAIVFVLRIDRNVIIRNLRLTPWEREQLKARTGQDRQLLGYPVETVNL